jgi:Transglycosylase SLT domain
MTHVPAKYFLLVEDAAHKAGLPESVVAAQINLESGFDPNAVSPTGAEGIAQFEPGTWSVYGHGSPFNPADAMHAYADYMGTLLRMYHGNVRNALAAYNAGPGDLSAGYGYADSILSAAGKGTNITSGGGSGQSPSGTTDSITGDLFGNIGGDIINAVLSALGIPSLSDLLERAFLVFMGLGLIIIGIVRLDKGGSDKQSDSKPDKNSDDQAGTGAEQSANDDQTADDQAAVDDSGEDYSDKPFKSEAGKRQYEEYQDRETEKAFNRRARNVDKQDAATSADELEAVPF